MSVDSLPTGDVPEPVGCFPNAGNSVRWFFLRVVPFGGAMLLAACGEPGEKDISTSEPAPLNPDQQVRRVVEREELILRLVPALRALADSLVSGERDQLPAAVAGGVTETVFSDLPRGAWQWEEASFGVLAGSFTGGAFEMVAKFEGQRRSPSELAGVRAKLRLTWKKTDGGEWQLVTWEQLSLEQDRSSREFFEEVLAQALPDGISLDAARRSLQEEITTKALAEQKLLLPKREYVDLADMESSFQYPAVSVVDYDGDGQDDLFVTSRWGSAQLLRNRGEGKFHDVTARVGLGGYNCANSALFADFDNDGDPDLLLGRSIEPTLYFANEGGQFREVTSELTDLGRQFFVTGTSAADVNRDGLLDVYLCTYNPGTDVQPTWRERYLPPGEAARHDALMRDAHPYFDDRGIANVLLMNRGGGRLERAGGEQVKLWRKSYQPCWFDADGDGDDDLYVCNDFAPDTFLRNDTPKGAAEPVLTDCFTTFFPDGEMAFGMGASLGDYDNDGDLDLFVSNMYSKAGNRIIAAVGKVDPRIEVAARGNFIYRNEEGTFRQAAEAGAPETRVGWAFGGQFADFNNDGALDLYVPSGFYTAPKTVATEVDL